MIRLPVPPRSTPSIDRRVPVTRAPWTIALVALLALAAALASPLVRGHELRPAVADLARDGDTLAISLRVNVEALLAGIGVEHDDTDDSPRAADYDALRALAPDALRARLDGFLPELLDGLELTAPDGPRLDVRLASAELPPVGDVRVVRDSTLRLEASLGGAERVRWRWAETFGPVIVRSASGDGPDAFSVYLLPGDTSDPLPLGRSSAADAEASASPAPDAASSDGSADAGEADGGETTRRGGGVPSGTFANYVRVGFVHIVPLGLDHILFVVGLFLLAPRARPILWQVTAFTLAHSVTLALATLGLVSVPGRVVEPLIALSIVVVAVENLFAARLHRWRIAFVFAFGLLHGLGFASVLEDVGGGTGAFLTRLLAFNVGVELGQLAVVLTCFALVGYWFRDRSWYRSVVTVPGSLAIASIGLFWFVERVLG